MVCSMAHEQIKFSFFVLRSGNRQGVSQQLTQRRPKQNEHPDAKTNDTNAEPLVTRKTKAKYKAVGALANCG